MGIKQGDQYLIPIKIKSGGVPLNVEIVDVVEVTFGELTKEYPTEITYDSETSAFLFPVRQDETFAFRAGSLKMDVRVKFHGGDVVGLQDLVSVNIPKALSREIL